MFPDAITWLRRGFVIYQWPLPVSFLFAVMAITNPPPYLVQPGNVQRTLFAVAAFAMFVMIVAPREMWVRNLGVLFSTIACGWRVTILAINGADRGYDGLEVIAFAAVWVVIALMVVQMTVLTWPTVSLGRKLEEDRRALGSG